LAGPGFAVYCSAGINSETPKQLQIVYGTDNEGIGGAAKTITLPGAYADYMGRWLQVILSVSPSQTDFSNWTGTGSGDRYVRMVIYDQETGEQLAAQDRRWDAITEPDVANLPTTLPSKDPYTTTVDSFELRVFNSNSVDLLENLTSMQWFSYGTMFDPFSIDQATVAWRTTRPSGTIGNAVAWCNCQTTLRVDTGTTPNQRYWLAPSGMDLLTAANDEAYSRFSGSAWYETNVDNPSEVWSNCESALIPKDRNT
jgi:hypothetical protein